MKVKIEQAKVTRKLHFKNKPVFFKIFLNLLVISLLGLTLLSGTMVFWFNKKTSENLDKINRLILLNIESVFSDSTKVFTNMCIELYNNPDIIKLMASYKAPYEMDSISAGMSAINQINKLMTSNTSINSIYLLNATGVAMNTSKLHEDNKSRNAIYKKVSTERPVNSPFIWTMNNKYAVPEKEIKTMTFFYSEGHNTSKFTGAVVINVNLELLEKRFLTDFNNPEQDIFIIDKNGTVVLGTNEHLYGENLADESFFMHIRENGGNYGSFYVSYKGNNNFFSYVPTSEGNYYIVSQMEYTQSINDIKRIIAILSVAILAIILITVVISLLASRNIYRPIENIVKAVETLLPESSKREQQNELSFLSDYFSNTINKLNSIEKENDLKTIAKLLLSSDDADKDILKNLLIKAGAVKDQYRFTIAAIRIIDLKKIRKEYSANNFNHMLSKFSEQLYEMISHFYGIFLLHPNPDELVIFMRNFEPNNDISVKSIEEVFKEAMRNIYNCLGIQFAVGYINNCELAHDIPLFYSQASICVKRCVFYEEPLLMNALLLSGLKPEKIPIENIGKTVQALKDRDKVAYETDIREAISLCSLYTYEQSIAYLGAIAHEIMEIEKSLNRKSYDTILGENMMTLLNVLAGFDSYNTLFVWFCKLFDYTSKILDEINNTKLYIFMKDVLVYIEENYTDPQLSAAFLADKVNITPQYFSKVFYEVTGSNLPDYINSFRLEKAREIISEDSSKNLVEIAESVGFGSADYFAKKFKSKYGITPSKYRSSKFELLNN